jgi:predicted nucleic acid-binding Zn ribbon protein
MSRGSRARQAAGTTRMAAFDDETDFDQAPEWGDADDDDPDAPQPGDLAADADVETMTVPCPHCGAQIAEEAQRCPQCGDWIESEPHGYENRTVLFLLAAGFVIVVAVMWLLW